MRFTEKYDRMIYGALFGFLIPVLTGLVIWLFSKGNLTLIQYAKKIVDADISTHIISLCVFPNIFLFLLLNRLDMLRATRGMLGITLAWAIIVFGVKFLA
ncbi:MAG: hypothetical protein RBR81_05765 [Bacteroidales bacterium]|jgi:uncharacterized YccA/Bax inhibitor family protein|nr:hypothetical protein [Bacteroidales bacterium]